MSNKIGVYLLKTPTGKCYVGMTCDSFERRWAGHLRELRRGVHKTTGLVNSYRKYGWDSIEKVILEEWDKPSIIDELKVLEVEILKRERYWWEQLASDGAVMLHGCPTGTGSVFHSKHTQKLISESNIIRGLNNPKNCFTVKELEYVRYLFEVKGLPKKTIALMMNKNSRKISEIVIENKWKKPEVNPFGLYEKLLFDFPILKWHFKEGKSAVEISEIVGCSHSHISSALRFAKSKDSSLDGSLARQNNIKKVSESLKSSKSKCKYCEKTFGSSALKRHELVCVTNQTKSHLPNCEVCNKKLTKKTAKRCKKCMYLKA